jgi:hypothetical protein
MGRQPDRDSHYMRQAHGTSKLITDYGVFDNAEACKNDPSSIRNSDDYDDWEYGTEPIPHDHTWTRKRSS